jgi:hypothetical protein
MCRRFMLAILLLAVAATTSAGGGLSYEYQAFKGKVPFAQTALIFAVDDRNMEFRNSNISKVDGKGVGFMGPMRTSARVLPGTHQFQIKAIWDFSGRITGSTTGVTSTSSFKERDMQIEVKDMLPLHVYVIRYRVEGEQIALFVEDLGERAAYHPYVLTRAATF